MTKQMCTTLNDAVPRAVLLLGLVVLGTIALSGCGEFGVSAPSPTPSLPDISEVEPVLQTGPTPVVLSLVYQDDFTDQSSGWDDAFDQHTLKQYGAHKYHIEVNAPNLFAWGVANRDIADFVLEVTTKQWEGPDNNSYGVIFRLQDKDNFYRFDITGDGFFLLSKFVEAKWLTLVDWTASPAVNTGQAENKLRVSALGSHISVYANGNLLAEVEDNSFRHGDIGFFAGAFDQSGVHVSFDDLQVWAPPGSEIALRATATPTAAVDLSPTLTQALTMPAEAVITATPRIDLQPTGTAAGIALGQPTATSAVTSSPGLTVLSTAGVPTQSPFITRTVTPGETRAAATVRATVPISTPSSTLVAETLPGYVSAVQPKPKEAVELQGVITYPVFDGERGAYDIYLAKLTGGELGGGPVLIQEDASQPSLSADGKQLAFRSWDKVTRGLLYRSMSSTNIKVIVKNAEAAHPVWGPSGTVFYYHSREESDRVSRLYRADGDSIEPLKYAGDVLRGESPSLLGDDRLVYKGCMGNDCGLMSVDLEGGAPQQLTSDLSDSGPQGSPDGQRIAFMTQRGGNWDIYVMNADGSGIENLTPDASNEGLPAWSPDGRSIAFLSDRNEAWGLWVMESDGSNQYRLLQLKGSPDGKVETAQDFTTLGWTEEQISWAP